MISYPIRGKNCCWRYDVNFSMIFHRISSIFYVLYRYIQMCSMISYPILVFHICIFRYRSMHIPMWNYVYQYQVQWCIICICRVGGCTFWALGGTGRAGQCPGSPTGPVSWSLCRWESFLHPALCEICSSAALLVPKNVEPSQRSWQGQLRNLVKDFCSAIVNCVLVMSTWNGESMLDVHRRGRVDGVN